MARHLASKRLTIGEVTFKPIRTLAGVIGHFWQPRRCIREIKTMLMNLAVAGMVAIHQLRRTPRKDSSQTPNPDTAQRKAA